MKDDEPKARGIPGPKSEYTPEAWDDRARSIASLGATSTQIAEGLGISRRTFFRWMTEYPSFAEAVKVGRDPADQRVKRSLFERACGYTYTEQVVSKSGSEVKVIEVERHVLPDPVSMIFWLKNRLPDEFKDRTEKHHTGAVQVEHQDADEARAKIARYLEREKQRMREEGDTQH